MKLSSNWKFLTRRFCGKIWCFFAVQKTVLRDIKLQSVVKNQNVSRSNWQFFSKLNHELRQKWELRETRDYWHYFFIEYLDLEDEVLSANWFDVTCCKTPIHMIRFNMMQSGKMVPRRARYRVKKVQKFRWKEDCFWRNLPKWIYLHSSTRLQVSYDMINALLSVKFFD